MTVFKVQVTTHERLFLVGIFKTAKKHSYEMQLLSKILEATTKILRLREDMPTGIFRAQIKKKGFKIG
jgi:hypothetical protein